MNGYMALFGLAAILGFPLRMEVTLRMSKKLHYRIRFRLAGIRIAQKREKDEKAKEKVFSTQTAKGLFSWDGRLAWHMLRGGHVMKALRVMHLDGVHIHVHFSFQDAAWTAMTFACAGMLLHTLEMCLAKPMPLHGTVEMDYAGGGTHARVQCIFSCRLGILLAAVLRFAWAMLSARAELMKTEEGPYAAASH